MRLNDDQIQAIRQAATSAFGQGTSVWLFGSRVDDAKKGGDIDHGIEDKSATQKDSAIDKLFCSKFERTVEMRYSSASNKSRYLPAKPTPKPHCRS